MDLCALRDRFNAEGIMICFNGPFSHSIIEEIGQAVRNHLSAENLARAAVLDVFAIYIELAQNVKNYFTLHELGPEDVNSSIITIAKKDGTYVITSGNNMRATDVPELTGAIDRVNALDPAGLRKLFRQQMRKPREEASLGAGLGLLEIATRCTRKLEYRVSDVREGFVFFSLTAMV